MFLSIRYSKNLHRTRKTNQMPACPPMWKGKCHASNWETVVKDQMWIEIATNVGRLQVCCFFSPIHTGIHTQILQLVIMRLKKNHSILILRVQNILVVWGIKEIGISFQNSYGENMLLSVQLIWDLSHHSEMSIN